MIAWRLSITSGKAALRRILIRSLSAETVAWIQHDPQSASAERGLAKSQQGTRRAGHGGAIGPILPRRTDGNVLVDVTGHIVDAVDRTPVERRGQLLGLRQQEEACIGSRIWERRADEPCFVLWCTP